MRAIHVEAGAMTINRKAKTFHSIIELPITNVPGGSIPVLILEDGRICVYSLMFIRSLQRRNYSGSTQHKSLSAIGRLYDYQQGTKKLTDPQTKQKNHKLLLLERFCEARIRGTIQPGGEDETGLYWQSVRYGTLKDDVIYLSSFSRFLEQNFEITPFNPIEQFFLSSLQEAYKTSIRRKTSLLYHLDPFIKNQHGYNKRGSYKFRSSYGQIGRDIPKAFPPRKIIELIQNTRNIRDQLCFLLMGFGSLRESELLHLYVTDISLNRSNGTANVLLAHPSGSPYEWLDRQGKRIVGTRLEFLRQVYGRIPRNQHGEKHPEHSGWKSMAWDDAKRLESCVYWSNPEAGRLFYRLHKMYMKEYRGCLKDDHPFYFVSLSDAAFGSPLKIKNLQGQFAAAARRIGLRPGDDGVDPHGLRHFYGYYLKNMSFFTSIHPPRFHDHSPTCGA